MRDVLICRIFGICEHTYTSERYNRWQSCISSMALDWGWELTPAKDGELAAMQVEAVAGLAW